MTTLAPPMATLNPVRIRPTPHRFTVAEYARIVDLGLVPPGPNVEFIRGEIVHKMAQGILHDRGIERINKLLVRTLPDELSCRCQCSLTLRDSVPIPDFVVCLPEDRRGGNHPTPGSTFLVIEVADGSLADDRTEKLELYAANGIVEYWIVNLPGECIEVYTGPIAAEMRYDSRVVYGRGQNVSHATVGLAVSNIPVDSLLTHR